MHDKPLASLKKRADFKRVFARGKSTATPLFVLYAAENDLGQCRLGLSVSKKVGCAVRRNRIKRLVREFFRTGFEETGQAYDFIVIAREPSGKLPREGAFAAVGTSLAQLLKRLGVVK